MAEFSVRLEYEGWFGLRYNKDPVQILTIADTDSFTGGMWGKIKE